MLKMRQHPVRQRRNMFREGTLMNQTTATAPDPALFEVALHVYRYARRYAVGQSHHTEDAVIYDACLAIINETYAPRTLGSTKSPSAVHDRYLRYGAEQPSATFAIPVAVSDALVILHRYARRYTNGRGTYTAALVNDTAKELLRRGIDLDETQRRDGSIWAADGVGGEHDGLIPAQRASALASLPAHEPSEP